LEGMKTNIVRIAGLLVAIAGLSVQANAESLVDGSAEAGKTKSTTCAACHGADGNSVNPEWPSLAGQHSRYIYNQLKAFKDGDRDNVLMTSQAAMLSDQDMRDLAVYYEKQSPAARPVADADLVNAGEQIYRGGNSSSGAAACVACHGPNGKGNPAAAYPDIGGQHATYVAAQLRLYKSGKRKSDQSQMMRNVSSRLSDADIAAIASYVQGLY